MKLGTDKERLLSLPRVARIACRMSRIYDRADHSSVSESAWVSSAIYISMRMTPDDDAMTRDTKKSLSKLLEKWKEREVATSSVFFS